MSAAVEPLLIEIEGGVILCLPPVLNTITTYVALEQEDWFEEEIAFVRRFLRPGMNAIDIGANYGVYGLTMAKAVGPGGRVVCIEPASETLAHLRAAIEQNGLTNIDLRAAALSAAPGRQRLRLEQSAELHRLDASSSDGELVEVETLDGVAEGFADGTLDFLKLDAEGEELNILKGSARTLARQSPLILFERKHVETVNTPVIEALAAAGFAMYRVATGLNMLVPYDPTSENRFQLNLIACRPDRAQRLAADGLLAAVPPPAAEPDPQAWARDFGGKPYFAPFATRAGTADRAYGHALNLYATAMSPATPPARRWPALHDALGHMLDAIGRAGSAMRLMSLVRIAADAGERDLAVQALRRLPVEPGTYAPGMVTEPFLAVSARFEGLRPDQDFPQWCAVAVLEQYDRLRAFSSQYANDRLLPAFDALRGSRYFSAPMERRRQLIRMRTGRQQTPEPTALLAKRSASHRNVAFWVPQEAAAGSTAG